ncbi:MAG: S8 family serine peptidase [bacterium]|nr:S8 family serine peptidase [bacterium]
MMSPRRHGFLFFSALLACFVIVHAGIAVPYEISFHSEAVVPPAGQFDLPPTPLDGSNTHCLIQLNESLARGQRAALAAAGVELLVYLPDRAYVASVRAGVTAAELSARGVRHASPMLAKYKLHPRVVGREFSSWSALPDGRRILAVEIMPDVTLDDAAAIITGIGGEAGHRFEAVHTLLVAIDESRVEELADLDAVLFVNEAPPPLDMVNDVVRTRLHVNEIQAAPYNLNGDSVTILVYDGGMVDNTHPDFGDRVTWNETASIADHPTHVAGTVGGDGSQASGTYRGIAPAARIISGQYDACIPYCLYDSPNDFEEDYTRARTEYGVELTTNSIGANIDPNGYPCDWFGDYEMTSRLLDQMTRSTADQPLIMFFAAGNERNGTNCGATSYRCMSVPAGAKNIISVGATTGTDAVASFSSFGPTDDGRLKPEICATGVGVTSCSPGPSYGYQEMSGTSMATPAAAGTGCLILQQWHRLFPGAPDPLPETMKAILINSTTDIGTAGPDFQTGFGLVNGLQAVQNLLAGGVLESALEIGEQFEHAFTVPAGLSELNVSLAWSDFPAGGNVIPTLVNDLDLRLIDPEGTPHEPWLMRHHNPGAPVTHGRDSVNVCEKVTVTDPISGTWTLRVSGTLNSGDSQTFGLSANAPLMASWATITGQLRQTGTGDGIAGRVMIVGGSQTANTDAEGNYVLSVRADASYTIRAISYGYVPHDTLRNVSAGNLQVNFSLALAANGTISGYAGNQLGAPLPGTTITFRFPMAQIPPASSDAAGFYTATLPGANFYDVTADYAGHTVAERVFVSESGTTTLNLIINDSRFGPAGPDDYGYYAYEAGDPGASAAYDWLEISPTLGGPGTAVTGTGNDWQTLVNAPFPIRFYGQDYTQLAVGADGWVKPGAEAGGTLYRNVGIPAADEPNGMICVFWDDLYPNHPQQGGDVSYYHDSAGGRFIVEYNTVPHYAPPESTVTAQIVFYSTTVRPTLSGDNEFQLQYRALNYHGPGSDVDADATVGIENADGTNGIQIVYDGTYDAACFELEAEYALRFTTGAMATVEGQLVMIPPVADITAAVIQIGARTVHPSADGSYSADSVIAGVQTITASYAGYETGQQEYVVIPEGGTVQADFELYRLDPALNLSGEYRSATQTIALWWEQPQWGGGALDDLTGYRIMLGEQGEIATIADTSFTYSVEESGEYDFWIVAVYDGGAADSSNHVRVTVSLATNPMESAIPETFYLSQNFPNPFNPTTLIEYGLAHAAEVSLTVYDVLGRTVAVLQDGSQAAGIYRVAFDARRLGSGVYFYRIKAGGFEQIRKMLLIR